MADSDDDPDAGKDFYNLVPAMSVDWDTPPSFNLDPSGQSSGQASSDVADSGPISFDATTVRATENTLLAQSRNAVSNYEWLRGQVDHAAHGQFWGPAHTAQTISSGQDTASQTPNSTGGSPAPAPDWEDKEDQNTLADIGDDFARHINPAMQKALALQSNALELLGDYIAMINSAGQSYAHIDKAAGFPEPPGSVTH
ncbi:hypothetical protein SAMN05216223_1254 [Actinacidiphila yanglinensis]|uniref:Uncharacterized protein n=1 Tax=Actinacidiphila yanglinensis TaxID=310779 RepID=A0A1H6E2Q1_9ACTN|nr:hypothetical protein [Actinacidiphila yanglinensis]SEG91998.1 hypothetical protein SAMN05216223_1254 [Actinacidiphila yanglinensis]